MAIINNPEIKWHTTREGLIIYHQPSFTTIRLDREETESVLGKKIDFKKLDCFPEIIHLSVSSRCNMSPACPYCYSEKGKKELTTEQWKKIIRKLSDFGVHQVSFGGACPFLREDICVLGKYANSLDLNPTITTNGISLCEWSDKELDCFKKISVSWHKKAVIFENALEYLKEIKIPRCINYIYDKRHENDLRYIKNCAEKYEADILFLVYKPVIGDYDNQILGDEVLKTATETAKEGYTTGVDSPCLGECYASKRFCTIDSEGNFMPCSFMKNSKNLNFLNMPVGEIWKNRDKTTICSYIDFKCSKSNRKS